jgi:hypothetical protein
MTSEWREYNGELPATLRTLGAVPVHFGSAWWVRLGSAVMVAGTPPANLFPPGRWVGIQAVPEGTTFPGFSRHGSYSVSLSGDGNYLRIAEQNPHSTHSTILFYKKQALRALTLRGAPRLLGAISSATVGAAQAVNSYFTSNVCTQDSVPEVVTFQNSWNADNAGTSSVLTVDGQYGPLTQGALENALGTTAVPANCFGGPAQPPAPDGTLPTNNSPVSTGVGPLPYIIGAVVVAGALAAYTYSKKSRRHHR